MMLILQGLACCFAALLIIVTLWDAFETIVLPRRIAHRVRLTRMYFRSAWHSWTRLARRFARTSQRESFLAVFGPLALIGLLVLWVALLIIGFGVLQWGFGSALANQGRQASLATDLYFSGTTLLTLGLGDVIPQTGLARAATVVEVGTGFGLLALVIGYLPVLYQAFSRREVRISLLDAHAGSPPTVGALLLRHPPERDATGLTSILAEWEGWSAELLESHLSYPVLAYYRSQHEEQSWVAALTMILDACALVLACAQECTLDERLTSQAAFTFAIARHAAADLAQSFAALDGAIVRDCLADAERTSLADLLATVGLASDAATTGGILREVDALRRLYEPDVAGLAERLLMPLPRWVPAPGAFDDWQTTADDRTAPPLSALMSRHPARHEAPPLA